MEDIWCIFYVRDCRHTHPVKNKFVIIVCRDTYCMGFLFNTGIGEFVKKKPELLKSQLPVKSSDYHFLHHDSYIDCGRIYPFDFDDLSDGRGKLLNSTKSDIKKIVTDSTTIEKQYIQMILKN